MIKNIYVVSSDILENCIICSNSTREHFYRLLSQHKTTLIDNNYDLNNTFNLPFEYTFFLYIKAKDERGLI